MDWTKEQIALLRTLWGEGHSTTKIGEMMGLSKNAIGGKSRRLRLPQRSSPIRKRAEPQAPKSIRHTPPDGTHNTNKQATSGVNGHLATMQHVSVTLIQKSTPFRDRPPSPIAPPPKKVPPRTNGCVPDADLAQHTQRKGQHTLCCWPIGEPGEKGFRFCGKEAIPKKPYCEEHAARAYVRPTPPQPDGQAVV